MLRRRAEEKISITQFFALHFPRAKLAQMLRALPFIGDFIAVDHFWPCLCRLCLGRRIHAGQCSAGSVNNLGSPWALRDAKPNFLVG